MQSNSSFNDVEVMNNNLRDNKISKQEKFYFLDLGDISMSLEITSKIL